MVALKEAHAARLVYLHIYICIYILCVVYVGACMYVCM